MVEQVLRQNGSSPGRGMGLWAWAVLIALASNFALFGLMPLLMPKAGRIEKAAANYDPVSVIRQKKPETPARTREKQEKKPEEKKENLLTALKRPAPKKPALTKPNLPFHVNSRLPAVSGDMTLPDLANFSIGPPPEEPSAIRLEFLPEELDHPLAPVYAMPPVYPFRARKMGIEGYVTVVFTVDEQGGALDPQVTDSKPAGIFEEAVIRCVSSWRFSPPTREGRPVRTKWQRTIEFTLQ